MSITNGQVIDADDFLDESDGSAGKVAKTKAGGKLDRSFIPARVALTVVPDGYGADGYTTINAVTNTLARVGLISVPHTIEVSKVSFRVSTVSVAGTVDVSLYTEDGQTRVFSVTSGTLVTQTIETITLGSPVTLEPGNYYVVINANGTTDALVHSYSISVSPFSSGTANLNGGVSGERVISGTMTITSGTPPTTFDPTALTVANNQTLVVRFDT